VTEGLGLFINSHFEVNQVKYQPTRPPVTGSITILGLCLAVLLPLALAGCSGDQSPASNPTQTLTNLTPGQPTDEPWEEDMSNEQPMPTDMVFPETTQTHDPELVAAFTPEGATVHADVESMLTLSSEMSLDEMIAFTLAAAEQVGASQNSIDSAVPGFWTYSGTLEGNQPLTVELRDDGPTTAMIVSY